MFRSNGNSPRSPWSPITFGCRAIPTPNNRGRSSLLNSPVFFPALQLRPPIALTHSRRQGRPVHSTVLWSGVDAPVFGCE